MSVAGSYTEDDPKIVNYSYEKKLKCPYLLNTYVIFVANSKSSLAAKVNRFLDVKQPK